jgi:homoserine kinase
MSDRKVRVAVPATTANLGPGYDSLGLALGLHNEIELALADKTTVAVEGEGAESLARDDRNLVLKSARRLAEEAGRDVPGWQLLQVNRIPLARGMGSSSAAIVAGLVAANHLLELGLPSSDLLSLASEIEGHPDNVAPALLGGLTVCCADPQLSCLPLPGPDLQVVVAIPNFEVSTEAARKVMPTTIPHSDGVYNVAHAALTVAALVSGQYHHLRRSLGDRLHQPYRAHLVPGFEQVCEAALAAGAYGAALSGSGPTVAAFAGEGEEAIAAAMTEAFRKAGVRARSLILPVDSEGAKVL